MGDHGRMARSIDTYLESGTKRVFAGALEWPGWSRAGKDESAALAALLAYGPRYRAVLSAGPGEGVALDLQVPDDVAGLRVVERLEGGAGTDFGVPGLPPSGDESDLEDDGQIRRLENGDVLDDF